MIVIFAAFTLFSTAENPPFPIPLLFREHFHSFPVKRRLHPDDKHCARTTHKECASGLAYFFVDVNKKIMITKHPTSRTLIVHPLGDLDTLRADHYRRQIRSLIDEGYRFLIFDLQDTPYINSSGLGLLIELFNKASRLEGSVN
jgi:anti-anti-sigma factor